MFGVFFLTLCFYSFLLSVSLRQRWCFLASSVLTLIILKPSPVTYLQVLSSVIYRLWSCLATPDPPWCPLCYLGHRTTRQSQLWSPSLSRRAAKSPSKRWLQMSCGQNIPAWKITYSCTFTGNRVSKPYQNKSLHLSHARIPWIYYTESISTSACIYHVLGEKGSVKLSFSTAARRKQCRFIQPSFRQPTARISMHKYQDQKY